MVQKKKTQREILPPNEVSVDNGDLIAYNGHDAEQMLIMMAYEEAARQIKSHTAASSTINHFLKLGSEREQLERQKIINDNQLSKAKVEQLSSQSQAASDSKKAIDALKQYSPSED